MVKLLIDTLKENLVEGKMVKLAPYGRIFRSSHNPDAAHLPDCDIEGKREILIQLN